MSLRSMMTATASTQRRGAVSSSKSGDLANNLTSLLITPVMLSNQNGNHAIRQLIGVEGTAVQIFEAYSESHTHTDSSVEVTQMPDIIAGDRLIVGSVTYSVKWAEIQPATFGFGATLMMYLLEDKRI